MVKNLLLLLCLPALLFLASCSNAPTGENMASEKGDAMAKFTSDTEFRDAHEKPAAINYKGKGEMMEFRTPDGSMAKAYAIKQNPRTTKYLFVIHEWWGLNDHIKQEADRLFDSLGNVTVLALDMYDGQVTDNPDEAGKIMNALKPERAEAIINGALAVAGKDGEVATIGWCFGGGWSLRASILAEGRGAGCVMYYGMPVETAEELAPLNAPILGIFAKKDGWINEPVINKFVQLSKATGESIEVHWYDADHAFANPSSPRYNEEAAQDANKIALAFLREKLR